MKKNMIAVFTALLIILTCTAEGQDRTSTVTYKVDGEYTLLIAGSSNVRDWDASSDNVRETVVFGPYVADWATGATAALQSDEFSGSDWIDEVSFSLPAKSLDSGINALNETMYRHLLTDQHPVINYYISEVRNVKGGDNPDELYLTVIGVTRAAGENNSVGHVVLLTREQNGVINVSGQFDMKMTDFKIDPPTFMRGALVTEDLFQVQYKFTLVPGE